MFIWDISFRNGFGFDLSLVNETGVCETPDNEMVLAEISVFQLLLPFLGIKMGSMYIVEEIDD
jgi:hypothetical protein